MLEWMGGTSFFHAKFLHAHSPRVCSPFVSSTSTVASSLILAHASSDFAYANGVPPAAVHRMRQDNGQRGARFDVAVGTAFDHPCRRETYGKAHPLARAPHRCKHVDGGCFRPALEQDRPARPPPPQREEERWQDALGSCVQGRPGEAVV